MQIEKQRVRAVPDELDTYRGVVAPTRKAVADNTEKEDAPIEIPKVHPLTTCSFLLIFPSLWPCCIVVVLVNASLKLSVCWEKSIFGSFGAVRPSFPFWFASKFHVPPLTLFSFAMHVDSSILAVHLHILQIDCLCIWLNNVQECKDIWSSMMQEFQLQIHSLT